MPPLKYIVGALNLMLIIESKGVFKRTESFCLSYSCNEEFHVHCQVYNWSHSVMKELYKVFGQLLEVAKAQGHSHVYSVSKNPKFCLLYGAIDSGVVISGHNIMIWDLEDL